MPQWDPNQYQRFSDERSRPFFDLVGRVPDGDVRTVADLGCGPGNLTSTLVSRWPEASIVGVDNSSEMLATAAKLSPHPHLRFVADDIAIWQPERPLDRIISNAALQWVPDHPAVLRHLLERLPEGEAKPVHHHLSLEVRKKRFGWFTTNHHGEGRVELMCKASADMHDILRSLMPQHFHMPKYVGNKGWVGIWLDLPKVDWAAVEMALRRAYELVAPKKLLAELQ